VSKSSAFAEQLEAFCPPLAACQPFPLSGVPRITAFLWKKYGVDPIDNLNMLLILEIRSAVKARQKKRRGCKRTFEQGATMKKPFLISLAVLLLFFSANVCQARDSERGEHQCVGQQMFYNFDDRTHDDSIRNESMRFQNFSFEICEDPIRIEDMAFQNVDDGTSADVGCTILYNFDW
jgi:hypothetical protein